MMDALKDLLASKKAIVMMATVALAIADKLGLNLDPDLMTKIVVAACVYMVSQGIADHGATAAKVNAASTAATMAGSFAVGTPPPQPEPTVIVESGR